MDTAIVNALLSITVDAKQSNPANAQAVVAEPIECEMYDQCKFSLYLEWNKAYQTVIAHSVVHGLFEVSSQKLLLQ